MQKQTAIPTPDEIYAKEEALRTQHAAELAVLKVEREKIYEIAHPLNQMLATLSQTEESIKRANGKKAYHHECIAQHRLLIDAAIAAEGDTGGQNIECAYELRQFAFAPAILLEIDRWIAERENELPALRKQIIDYAEKHGLEKFLSGTNLLAHRA